MKRSHILRRFLGAYLYEVRGIWKRLPPSIRPLALGQAYGRHLHAVVRLHAERKQYVSTFFLRNRAELELVRRLLDQKAHGSNLNITVLACSKGAEVYSLAWTIRSARPDLRLSIHAVDISAEILQFARRGVYSRKGPDVFGAPNQQSNTHQGDVTWNTCRDQGAPLLERMTDEELTAMCEVESDQVRIKPWLKDGIHWLCGDAGDPALVGTLGAQDMVMANRFLCHMTPSEAERCLRNIARLIRPGGYLFVSGVDLDVRTRVAQGSGWKPVTDLIRELHEGDSSLRAGWPLEYWGLEPFRDDRPDWQTRYASVFQMGESHDSTLSLEA